MLLTLASPDPYGYPECPAPQTNPNPEKKRALDSVSMAFLGPFELSNSSFSPYPPPVFALYIFIFLLLYFQITHRHRHRHTNTHRPWGTDGRPAQREMFAATDQRQNTSAWIHGVAYQNKTSSFAICQGRRDLVLIWRHKNSYCCRCTHNRQKQNTHSKHTHAHTELPQRNHVFQLPSFKEDTAVAVHLLLPLVTLRYITALPLYHYQPI